MKGFALKDPKRLIQHSNEKFFKDIAANHKDEAGEHRGLSV